MKMDTTGLDYSQLKQQHAAAARGRAALEPFWAAADELCAKEDAARALAAAEMAAEMAAYDALMAPELERYAAETARRMKPWTEEDEREWIEWRIKHPVSYF
jgi:hypothetical protein